MKNKLRYRAVVAAVMVSIGATACVGKTSPVTETDTAKTSLVETETETEAEEISGMSETTADASNNLPFKLGQKIDSPSLCCL